MQPSLPSLIQGGNHTPAGLGALSGVCLLNLMLRKTVASQRCCCCCHRLNRMTCTATKPHWPGHITSHMLCCGLMCVLRTGHACTHSQGHKTRLPCLSDTSRRFGLLETTQNHSCMTWWRLGPRYTTVDAHTLVLLQLLMQVLQQIHSCVINISRPGVKTC